MRIDLHVHSSVSDGTDTPTQLVLKAVAMGLDVIGLCDHDTFDGITEAVEATKRFGGRVFPGIEMSTQREGTSVHLLGYGCDPYDRALVEELARIRVGRSGRLPAMVDKLQGLGMDITVEDVMNAAGAAPSLGRPHVADALVAKGYVRNRAEAFERYIGHDGPAYVQRYATELEDAIDLIHKAKGIAVIAHPWGRDSRPVLPAEYLEYLARAKGLEGIEVDHQDHDADTRELLFQLGARAGLVRTGSSDYHGLGKQNHDLGCNLTRPTAFRELERLIRARGGTA